MSTNALTSRARLLGALAKHLPGAMSDRIRAGERDGALLKQFRETFNNARRFGDSEDAAITAAICGLLRDQTDQVQQVLTSETRDAEEELVSALARGPVAPEPAHE